jgi:HEAT repeat protein
MLNHHIKAVRVPLIGAALLIGVTVELSSGEDSPSARLLLERFKSTHFAWQQLEVAKEIVAIHDRTVVEQLEGLLEHEDRHLRGNAAFILAGLGDPRGFQVIVAILTDNSSNRALGPGIGIAPSDGHTYSLAQQIEADRYYAVHLLGELKDRRAIPVLIPLLSDDTINYNVGWALGKIGDRRAIRPLIDALKDSDALMRISAIKALEKMQAREAVPYLRALLNDRALPRGWDQITVGETARSAISRLEP